eukprot:c12383_g1_i1.p1 GENE.c12383_g1_i1~~c12383_g1_i1.p1  ORF type:complete len:421 (-),score=9.00 c12383_g1_i1:14-1276(-)
MGNKGSSKLQSTVNNVVVQVIKVDNVPKEDAGLSFSDPYVKLYITDLKGKKVGQKCQTLYFPNCRNPVWNSFCNFQVTIPQDQMNRYSVVCELWDYDYVSKNDKYGKIAFPLSALGTDPQEKIMDMKKSKENNTRITIRRLPTPMPIKKTIFIIRHGESAWNEAQEGKDIVGMVSQVDHPLNDLGCNQAISFNEAWKKIPQESLTEIQKTFLKADRIFSSPLTRTVQTCLLTMEGHPAFGNKGLTLLRNLREIKNLGGLDTVGKEVGEYIYARVKTEMEKIVGAEHASKACDVKLDFNDAVQSWWSGTVDRDNNDEMALRFEDWLATVQHASYDVGVFVGHSLFYRKFLKDYCSEQFKASNPEMATKMGSKKLQNAGCLALTLDFSSGRAQIMHAESMFGTGFVEGEDKEHTDKTKSSHN